MCLQLFHGFLPTSADREAEGRWCSSDNACLHDCYIQVADTSGALSDGAKEQECQVGLLAELLISHSSACLIQYCILTPAFLRTLKLNYFEMKLRELPVCVLHSNAFPVSGLFVHAYLCYFLYKAWFNSCLNCFCWSFFHAFSEFSFTGEETQEISWACPITDRYHREP